MIENPPNLVQTEPALPELPSDFLANKPKLSGACPPKANVLMFLAAIPISFVVGMLAHYVGIVVGFLAGVVAMLPSAMASVCGVVMCMFVVFAFIVVLGAFIGYPILVGYLNGLLVGELGKKGLCRNPKAAAWAGVWTGIFVYLGHVLISLLTSRTIVSLTASKELIEGLGNGDISEQSWFLILLAVIEFVLVLVGGHWGGKESITAAAFCEQHQQWYTKWRQGTYAIDALQHFAQSIQTSDLMLLDNVSSTMPDQYPHLILKTRNCPADATCPVELRGDVFWQVDKVDKQGKVTKENKSKLWFDVMAEADLAHDIEAKLGFKELTAKKGKKG